MRKWESSPGAPTYSTSPEDAEEATLVVRSTGEIELTVPAPPGDDEGAEVPEYIVLLAAAAGLLASKEGREMLHGFFEAARKQAGAA